MVNKNAKSLCLNNVTHLLMCATYLLRNHKAWEKPWAVLHLYVKKTERLDWIRVLFTRNDRKASKYCL